MIKVIITNTQTGDKQEFEQEPFSTMRTRLTPYAGECFAVDAETVICGFNLGTAVCKIKTGEVLYRNPIFSNDAPLKNLTCEKIIF